MTIPEIAIRQAKRDDIADIMHLYAQPQYDDGRVLDTDSAAAIFERTAHYPFYKFFVARHTDGTVGVYSLLIMENLGHMGSKSAIVEGVAVAPQAHGMGVGSAMMRHALEIASEYGCYKLALSSNLKRTGAHAFYERLGFRQHGVSYVIEPAAEAMA
jgi:GNAT superfamily N-acetyltransferase